MMLRSIALQFPFDRSWKIDQRVAMFMLTLALAACHPESKPPPQIVSEKILENPKTPDTLVWQGGLVLHSKDPRFGGISALTFDGADRRLTALTDTGRVFVFKLDRAEDGRIEKVTATDTWRLNGEDGRIVQKNKGDSEAILKLADGRWLVSFERRHRLLLYPAQEDGLRKRPQALAHWRAFQDFAVNKGIEAVLQTREGTLLAFVEEPVSQSPRLHRFFYGSTAEFAANHYREGRYAAAEGFSPTDAASLPNGDWLILERAFNPPSGFTARLVWVQKDKQNMDKAIEGIEILRLRSPGLADNYEGLALREKPDGDVEILIISDDNYTALQRTILLQFLWSPTSKKGKG